MNASAGSRSRIASGRCAARWRIASVMRAAALPVGAASAMRQSGSCAIRQASRLTTVVVLPVPGPPLMTVEPPAQRQRGGELLPVGLAVEPRRVGREEVVELVAQHSRAARRPARRARRPLRAHQPRARGGARSRSSGAGRAGRRRRARADRRRAPAGGADDAGREQRLPPGSSVAGPPRCRKLAQREADMAVGGRQADRLGSVRAARACLAGAQRQRPALDLARKAFGQLQIGRFGTVAAVMRRSRAVVEQCRQAPQRRRRRALEVQPGRRAVSRSSSRAARRARRGRARRRSAAAAS